MWRGSVRNVFHATHKNFKWNSSDPLFFIVDAYKLPESLGNTNKEDFVAHIKQILVHLPVILGKIKIIHEFINAYFIIM